MCTSICVYAIPWVIDSNWNECVSITITFFFLPQFFYCLILKMCRQIIIHCGRRFIPVGVNCDSCLLFNLQKIKSKKTLLTANCRFHTWYSKRLFHQPDNIWKRNSVAWLSFGFASSWLTSRWNFFVYFQRTVFHFCLRWKISKGSGC